MLEVHNGVSVSSGCFFTMFEDIASQLQFIGGPFVILSQFIPLWHTIAEYLQHHLEIVHANDHPPTRKPPRPNAIWNVGCRRDLQTADAPKISVLFYSNLFGVSQKPWLLTTESGRIPWANVGYRVLWMRYKLSRGSTLGHSSGSGDDRTKLCSLLLFISNLVAVWLLNFHWYLGTLRVR